MSQRWQFDAPLYLRNMAYSELANWDGSQSRKIYNINPSATTSSTTSQTHITLTETPMQDTPTSNSNLNMSTEHAPKCLPPQAVVKNEEAAIEPRGSSQMVSIITMLCPALLSPVSVTLHNLGVIPLYGVEFTVQGFEPG